MPATAPSCARQNAPFPAVLRGAVTRQLLLHTLQATSTLLLLALAAFDVGRFGLGLPSLPRGASRDEVACCSAKGSSACQSALAFVPPPSTPSSRPASLRRTHTATNCTCTDAQLQQDSPRRPSRLRARPKATTGLGLARPPLPPRLYRPLCSRKPSRPPIPTPSTTR